MISGNGGELYQTLLDGELDAAIIPQPPFAIPKVYDWCTLREERLIVVAPASTRRSPIPTPSWPRNRSFAHAALLGLGGSLTAISAKPASDPTSASNLIRLRRT